MKIAEEYFQRLLNSDDPIRAVADLAALWSPRAGRDQPLFGLAESEFNVHLCLWYSGEVANSGHIQFFSNPIGRYFREVIQALRAVGLPALAELLASVSEAVGGERVLLREDREDILYAAPAAQQRAMEAADRRAYDGMLREVDAMCLAYLRRHANEILLPER